MENGWERSRVSLVIQLKLNEVLLFALIIRFINTSHIAQALVEFGDSLKQMADVKYSLDDNVKQNFLEPLHQLQMKDLKEVMVRSEKIS